MLLPYASDTAPTRRPWATLTLIGVETLITAALIVIGRQSGVERVEVAVNTFGVVPERLNPMTLLSYSLVHVDPIHLLGNLFYLWIFGAGVEAALGWGRFLGVYFVGAAFGGLLQALITRALLPIDLASQPIIGASAACACLMGVYAVRYYRARISIVAVPWRIHVVAAVTILLAIEITAALWKLIAGEQFDGIAHWAHVGGFILGLVWAQMTGLADVAERDYIKSDAARAMKKSEPGAAIRSLEAMLAKEPNSASTQLELARAWLLLGDQEQASEWFVGAVRGNLEARDRLEAARLYVEMRKEVPHGPAFTPDELFALGAALEEIEEFSLAAETLRAATARKPDDAQTETAMVRLIGLYAHQLQRKDEADIVLRLFLERYPQSPWREQARAMLH